MVDTISLESGWERIKQEGIYVIENYLEKGEINREEVLIIPSSSSSSSSSSSLLTTTNSASSTTPPTSSIMNINSNSNSSSNNNETSLSSSSSSSSLSSSCSSSSSSSSSSFVQQQQPVAKTRVKYSLFKGKKYMELYTIVYQMCTQRSEYNWTAELYSLCGKILVDYVENKVLPVLLAKSGENLCRELKRRWDNHLIYNKWTFNIFQYLDRYYVQTSDEERLLPRGLKIFREKVFEPIQRDVRLTLLNLITDDREGRVVDTELIQQIINIYLGLGLDSTDYYQARFEKSFLLSTEIYYRQASNEWIRQMTFSRYLEVVEKTLSDEQQRSETYLHPSTSKKLSCVLQKTLLADRQAELLAMDTAVEFCLKEERDEDLKRAVSLFGILENALDPIASTFRQFLTAKGCAIIEDYTAKFEAEISEAEKAEAKGVKALIQRQLSQTSVIEDLLQLYSESRKRVVETFHQEFLFHKALKESFEVFMNKSIGRHSAAGYISTYCDQIMKRRVITATNDDQSIEVVLSKVVELFSFLTDKDLFADMYRIQLAKRLLNETSSSSDAEKLMIAKLKLRCGGQFTSKLEGMLCDLALAADKQREFKASLKGMSLDNSPLDNFSVTVLTTGFWPSYATPDMLINPDMQTCLQTFEQFYKKQTSHRKLQWIHHLGSATILGRMKSGRIYDFQCNSYQASFLLLFNEVEGLTVGDLQLFLRVDELLARKLIGSFVAIKLLTKKRGSPTPPSSSSSPSSPSSKPEEIYEIDSSFAARHRSIKVPVPVQDEAHNKAKVEEDRSFAIEAAVVRVMKSRKSLAHTQLVLEVMKQLYFFKPNPKVIKTKIENLIEREFLERSVGDDNAPSYNYLA